MKRDSLVDDRWQAVRDRDAAFDGVFVYAVHTTGIYCRPSCPARRPRRKHVVFFVRADEAERVGFRPCKRCRPQDLIAPQWAWVREICEYIETRAKEEPTLEEMSAHVGISPSHLHRTFKRVVGVTPRQYAEACRLDRLKAKLKEEPDVTRALYAAGYGSSSRLYEKAPGQLGMTPGKYRKGGPGMRIEYTIVNCPLGRLLVAATEKGLCAVSIGDSNSDAELKGALQEEYPAAQLKRGGDRLAPWVQAILNDVDGREPRPDLPLDVQATAFQRRVWRELQRIPYGQTRSYREVAQAIGKPRATRAVARACATNPVPLVIPCHRVVRSDGSLGGYRLGIERKRALLDRELRRKRSG